MARPTRLMAGREVSIPVPGNVAARALRLKQQLGLLRSTQTAANRPLSVWTPRISRLVRDPLNRVLIRTVLPVLSISIESIGKTVRLLGPQILSANVVVVVRDVK